MMPASLYSGIKCMQKIDADKKEKWKYTYNFFFKYREMCSIVVTLRQNIFSNKLVLITTNLTSY